MMLLPGVRTVAPARHDQMPYRVFFAQVAERAAPYLGVQCRRLRTRRAVPRRSGAGRGQPARQTAALHAGYQLVRRLLLRVDTFGFHLATLDLKQSADVHHRVIAQGIDDAGWMQRSRAERMRRAVRDPAPRRRARRRRWMRCRRRTLAVFEAAMQCRTRYGARAIGNYIIGAAEGVDDILAPLVLARWAGVDDRRAGSVGLDFAPLFGSVASLSAAGRHPARTAGASGLSRPSARARQAAAGADRLLARRAASAAIWPCGSPPTTRSAA